jgi:hypothetical protein
METLGLSSKPQKSDNIFQRLLWPTIYNQYDVDLLGQQGFWVCIALGTLSGVLLLLTGQFLVGLLTVFVFFAGACGVRERSVSAASVIFAIQLISLLSAYFISGLPPSPVISIVILMLLLANVRAAIISSRWIAAPPEESDTDLPERSTFTAADRFANTLPVTLWPKIKYVFFGVSALYLVLTIVGAVFLTTHRQPHLSTAPDGTLQVEPPR